LARQADPDLHGRQRLTEQRIAADEKKRRNAGQQSDLNDMKHGMGPS
jgi:hypothetical protein